MNWRRFCGGCCHGPWSAAAKIFGATEATHFTTCLTKSVPLLLPPEHHPVQNAPVGPRPRQEECAEGSTSYLFTEFIALVPKRFVSPLKTGCIISLNAPLPPSVVRSGMHPRGSPERCHPFALCGWRRCSRLLSSSPCLRRAVVRCAALRCGALRCGVVRCLSGVIGQPP